MKNSNTVLFVIITIAILAGGAYFFLPKPPMKSSLVMKKEVQEMMIKEDKKIGKQYAPYSKLIFDTSANTRRVLFFYANWCPNCKQAEESFEQNLSKIPEDVTLIRVNYNDTDTDQEEKELARKYGITYQHTFVQIDSEGREQAKWNGGQIDELLSNIK